MLAISLSERMWMALDRAVEVGRGQTLGASASAVAPVVAADAAALVLVEPFALDEELINPLAWLVERFPFVVPLEVAFDPACRSLVVWVLVSDRAESSTGTRGLAGGILTDEYER